MSSTVFAHAAEPTQAHLIVDTLLGVGAGILAVGLFVLFLRYVVASDRRRRSGG